MRLLAFTMTACLLLACTSEAPPEQPACPSDYPAQCPDAKLRWTGQVDAIVAAKCAPCHNPDGEHSELVLDTYDHVKAVAKSVGSQVYSCRMPAMGGAPLTAAERAALLGWLACGTPE